ncbi:MAG: type II toxin-antitoxin system RelE/ParE family toxin [Clostridiaceae bacterium]|jgi:plasmid stabilization system protein ParE|nr:type II toxin-antitoxin system RelE/ParE family toxin [Clostridiaceae bacterium]
MAKVIIHRKAEEDMLAIFTYISGDNIRNANMMLDRFEKAFELLEQFPLSGTKLKDEFL